MPVIWGCVRVCECVRVRSGPSFYRWGRHILSGNYEDSLGSVLWYKHIALLVWKVIALEKKTALGATKQAEQAQEVRGHWDGVQL